MRRKRENKKIKKYDLIVIGAGSGGLNVASFVARVGLKVLLVSKSEENIGGDCLNAGCVPSKALIHVSRLFSEAGRAGEFGLGVSGKVDMKKVFEYVRGKQEFIRRHENSKYLRGKGIDVVLGLAKFNSRNSVVVNGKEYFGKRFVVATGSRPRKLKVSGGGNLGYGKNYFDNENIFSLDRLPDRLVVVGGGPIGIELGQAFSRLGSSVTILERGGKFLPKERGDVTGVLLERLKSEGVDVRFNSSISKVVSGNKLEVVSGKKKSRIGFDALLVGIGRELNVDLDFEKAGVRVEGGRVLVDEGLRTTNKNIFLCGDVVGQYQFTHAAELHASVILNNFFSPLKKKVNYDNFSWVTFTDPEIATFGLPEEELKRRGVDFERIVYDWKDDDRAIVDEANFGKSVVFVSKGRILGGSAVGRGAGEIVQELILAMKEGVKISRFFGKTWAYPVGSRVNKGAFASYLGSKFGEFYKKIFRVLY